MNTPIKFSVVAVFIAILFNSYIVNATIINSTSTYKHMSNAASKSKLTINPPMKSKYRYYGEVSLMGGYNGFAVATMHGYIISQYARLGISLGYNLMVIKDVFPQLDHVDATYQLKGFSMMKGFIVTKIGYRCDLMHTLYTPYFQAEFGYAFPINSFEMDPYFNRYYKSAYSSNVHYKGGPTESIIIGVKRRTQKRISYKLGVDISILTNYAKYTTYNRDEHTEKQGVVSATKVGIGLRFSLGF